MNLSTEPKQISNIGFLERHFKLSERKTTPKTEILAGLTTFLTCVYIVAVNPAILSNAGMDPKAVFWATALIAGLGSIGMGLYANFPYAMAPAMGLNAYFAFYVVGVMKLSWENALGCVLISGLAFLVMSLFKIREKIVNAMPDCVKYSVGAGIGFFIAFVGLTQAGIVVSSKDTVLQMGDLGNPGAILALLGIALTAILVVKNIRGAMLIGILAVTVAGFFVTNPATGIAFTQLPHGGIGGLISFDNPVKALAPTLGQLSFHGLFGHFNSAVIGIFFVIFGFLFVDLFDGVAVLIGVSAKAGFLNEKGELPNAGKALLVDACSTTVGAFLGTSTVVVYGAESSTGVAEGGRTGLVAVVVGILFLLSLVFSPLFLMIPSVATAPALVMVGVFMMEPLKNVKLDDITVALPVFLAIAFMPFTYNIAMGIIFAVLGYTLVTIAAGKRKEITPMVWGLSAIFLIYIISQALHL